MGLSASFSASPPSISLIESGSQIEGTTLRLRSQDPGAYDIDYPSKGISFGEGGPILGDYVKWDVGDENANPTFEYGIGQNFQLKDNTIDAFTRGGIRGAINRRLIDVKRITKFFASPQGAQFIAKQMTLQAQNPGKPKFYNLGINTLQQIALAGIQNVPRGGALSLGGWQVGSGIVATNYETSFKKKERREIKYGLGDPGKKSQQEGLWNRIKQGAKGLVGMDKIGYDQKLKGKIDLVNALPILKLKETTNKFEEKSKDFVKFRIEIVDHDTNQNDFIVFRAFLDNLSDDFRASHNEFKYNGRGEPFYTYKQFNRSISVGFKIAAQTRWEMKPLYQKLNYLVAQTAPNYSAMGRIRTPYAYLTVGDWFSRVPGLITQVGLKWQKDYPWEIASDKGYGMSNLNKIKDKLEAEVSENTETLNGRDKDMLVLPHVLDVNLGFQPIHAFNPQNTPTSPFIGIHGGDLGPDWRIDKNNKKNEQSLVWTEVPGEGSLLDEGKELFQKTKDWLKSLGKDKDGEESSIDSIQLGNDGFRGGLNNSNDGWNLGDDVGDFIDMGSDFA